MSRKNIKLCPSVIQIKFTSKLLFKIAKKIEYIYKILGYSNIKFDTSNKMV